MKISVRGKNGLEVISLNRRKAIRERCLNCSCWIPSEVANCSFSDCPLYPFRSGQGKQNPKKRTTAIRQYCLWCCAEQKFEVWKCVSLTCPLFSYRMVGIDRSQEINSDAKFAHIEPVLEEETSKDTQWYLEHAEQ